MVYTKKLSFHMPHGNVVKDITHDVLDCVAESGVKDGTVTVQAAHSVCAVSTLEYEPGCIADLETALERLAPAKGRYEHSKRWHDENGHGHVRSAVMGASETFVIMNGKVTIETWQQIIFCDYCPNEHPDWRVYVAVIGE